MHKHERGILDSKELVFGLILVSVISDRGGWTVKSKATAAKTSNQTAAVLHYVFGLLHPVLRGGLSGALVTGKKHSR